VSIAETLATKSTVVAWDNSTRGLDASTALDYAHSLRVMTDISNRTTLVTLYQTGEGIYEVMEKVLVIDEGRMIYSGKFNCNIIIVPLSHMNSRPGKGSQEILPGPRILLPGKTNNCGLFDGLHRPY